MGVTQKLSCLSSYFTAWHTLSAEVDLCMLVLMLVFMLPAFLRRQIHTWSHLPVYVGRCGQVHFAISTVAPAMWGFQFVMQKPSCLSSHCTAFHTLSARMLSWFLEAGSVLGVCLN